MSGLNQDWYVARVDGETVGPLSRLQLAQMHSQHVFPADALAWHVEHSEWLPLARVVASAGALLQVAGAMSQQAPSTHKPKTRGSAKSSVPAQRAMVPPPNNAAASPTPARKKVPLPPRPADDRDRAAKADAAVAAARSHPTAAAAKAQATVAGAAMAVAVRRLLARLIDTLSLGLLGASVIWGLLMIDSPQLDGSPDFAGLLFSAVFVLVPLEALALSLTGRTPGKWLLGLRVHARDSANPGLQTALGRSINVLWRGVGLGLPPLTALAIVVAAVQTGSGEPAAWDKSRGLQVHAAPISGRSWQIALAALIGLLLLIGTDFFEQLAYRIAAPVI